MAKKILTGICVSLTIILAIGLAFKSKPDNRGRAIYEHSSKHCENMPIVMGDPFAHLAIDMVPHENRGENVRLWLSAVLKITVESGASGSGTIVYYDPKEGYAYFQSCGHLWNGNMNYDEGRRRHLTATLTAWYHNEVKLTEPKTYVAEVLYYSNTRGEDCSLSRFKPDWVPFYFPIAPDDFEYKKDMRLHSVGCDGGREVAHYDIRVLGLTNGNHPDLVTTENSPRPGRSGGGLMSDEFYVGICWGTSDRAGNGNGFFTPLMTVRDLNEKNGFGWLNNVATSIARLLPIIDRNNPQGKYPKDYIPIPQP